MICDIMRIKSKYEKNHVVIVKSVNNILNIRMKWNPQTEWASVEDH